MVTLGQPFLVIDIPFSPLCFLWESIVSRTSEEGISVHFSTTSPLVLWVAEKVTVLEVSITFRTATYSFKIAGVKIPWKLSSKCYKALYSILADKLGNNNPCDGKGVGGSATGGVWFVDSRDCAACCDSLCANSQESTHFQSKTVGFIMVIKVLPPALVVELCQVCCSVSASTFPAVLVRNCEKGLKPSNNGFPCVFLLKTQTSFFFSYGQGDSTFFRGKLECHDL